MRTGEERGDGAASPAGPQVAFASMPCLHVPGASPRASHTPDGETEAGNPDTCLRSPARVGDRIPMETVQLGAFALGHYSAPPPGRVSRF